MINRNFHRLLKPGYKLAAVVLCIVLLISGCRTDFPPLEESLSDPLVSDDSTGSHSDSTGTSGETTNGPSGTTSTIGTTADESAGSNTTTNSESETTTSSHTTTGTTPSTTPTPDPGGYTPLNYGTMKACWLSQFDMLSIYKVNGRQRDKADFTRRVEQIFDNLRSRAINTVIVQVRPYADSFYPSEYYPWSNYVTGSHKTEGTYDPLAIMVEAAHARGLSIHAWVNPMRGMTETQIADVGSQYPIRQWYDAKRGKYIVLSGGRWYLEPAYPEVRKLIADGIAEIVRNYDIDGIHIDDYFYPTTPGNFHKSYENTNAMVREIYQAIKAIDSRVLFGVSPAGNVNNNLTMYYADVNEWCSKSGYAVQLSVSL